MNFSIRTKLGFGFGFIIVMLVLLVGVVQYKTSQANKHLAKASSAVEVALKLQGEIHHALSMHRGYMILGLPALSEERLSTWDLIDGYIVELDAMSADWHDPEQIADYAEFKQVMADFRVAQQQIADVAWSEENLPANVQYFDVAEPYGDQMVESLQAILDEEQALEATAERKLLVRRVSEAEGHLLKSRNAIASYLGSGKDEHLERINSCLTACQASVDRLMTMTGLFTDSQTKHYEEYIAARTVFIEKAKEAVSIRSNAGYCVSEDICLNTVTPLANQAGELIGVIGEKQAEFKAASMAKYNDANQSMVATVKVVGLVSIVVSSVLAFFLSSSITRRLGALMEYASSIADRDLSIDDLQIKTKDEIGRLADAVNVMKNSIKGVISDVSHTTQAVASASTELAASAEQMAAGMDTQQQQTQQVAAAVEELSQSVGEVAAKSSDATTASVESQRLAEDGGGIVSNTVEEMQGIAREVQSSADTINTLGQKSQMIGEIIAVINDIADQTNLLALNAAIEAARAGEHGRGFAVVADEVRKLAERTTEATEEVSQSILGIQTETESAVTLIEAGSERVGKGVDLASQAGEALRSIVDGSKGVQGMVQDIAAAANEQTAAADEIARAVEGINSVTSESSVGASQASQAASDLAVQAEQLQEMVGGFKLT
ncbi:MAG: methyl-accepting chemotaxis protein [Phycisphaerales bacterium]|nr:methyl-accepting chemotaxis protein [Phycisphaerales bacterium]